MGDDRVLHRKREVAWYAEDVIDADLMQPAQDVFDDGRSRGHDKHLSLGGFGFGVSVDGTGKPRQVHVVRAKQRSRGNEPVETTGTPRNAD